MDKLRLEFATEIFLSEMRRQQAAKNEGVEGSVKSLHAYPTEQRSALMRAIEKACAAVEPKSDEVFLKWKIGLNR